MDDEIPYARQSVVTDPGPFAGWVDALPADLESLRRAARQLVFHYRAGGDFTANGIEPARISEVDSRYVNVMLGRLFELDGRPLGSERPARQRIVGCCRDVTVLFLTMARQKGIPARERVGFATYFTPDWNGDHVVAEVWDGAGQRWRLVDAELADGYVDPSDGAVLDPSDMSPERFLTGPAAWRACRSGNADPDRFLVHPELEIPLTRGWPYLAHNLVQDLAALNRTEMLLWDYWGIMENPLDDSALGLLDEVAAADPAGSAAVLQALFVRDELRIPDVVTSYSPAHETALRVDLAS